MKPKHSRISDPKSAAKPAKGYSKSSSSALALAADAARARLSKTLATPSSGSKVGKKSASTSPNAIAALAKSAASTSTGTGSSEGSSSKPASSRHSRAKTTEVAQALDAAFDAIVMTQLAASSDTASSASSKQQQLTKGLSRDEIRARNLAAQQQFEERQRAQASMAKGVDSAVDQLADLMSL